MKKIIIGLMGLVGLMGLTGCEKEKTESDVQGRDIYYTVGDTSMASIFSSQMAHVTTEAEWDALLEEFCDYAEGGSVVTFYHPGTQASRLHAAETAAHQTKERTSISTTDREELKAWMKEMEKAGKTVQVTYDNGTWNGRAYANIAPTDAGTEVRTLGGTLAFVTTPLLDNPPLGGVVMALQTDAEGTYIISIHGMMLWFDDDPEGVTELLEGSQATFTGVVSTHTDLNGESFQALDLEMPESGVIEF